MLDEPAEEDLMINSQGEWGRTQQQSAQVDLNVDGSQVRRYVNAALVFISCLQLWQKNVLADALLGGSVEREELVLIGSATVPTHALLAQQQKEVEEREQFLREQLEKQQKDGAKSKPSAGAGPELGGGGESNDVSSFVAQAVTRYLSLYELESLDLLMLTLPVTAAAVAKSAQNNQSNQSAIEIESELMPDMALTLAEIIQQLDEVYTVIHTTKTQIV